jgi:hypothetical protein
VPGAAIVPGSLAPGQVEIAPPPGPLPGSAASVAPVIVTAPVVAPPPAAIEAPAAAPPAAPVVSLPPNVIISPPNTGDGGLVDIGKSPLTAALVGISTLVFGVGLLVLSGRI